jgi:hypothetical protein
MNPELEWMIARVETLKHENNALRRRLNTQGRRRRGMPLGAAYDATQEVMAKLPTMVKHLYIHGTDASGLMLIIDRHMRTILDQQ